MIFSVLIALHNERKKIQQTLKCIKNQYFPKNQYEIIVIDDNSSDDSSEIAEKFGARVIKFQKNIGASEARRIGIKHCKGDIIIFLDAHLYLFDKSSFSTINRVLEENPKIIGICGHYKSREKSDMNQFRDIRREAIFHKTDKERIISLKHFTTLSMAICAIRKSVFKFVNFHEGFKKSLGEDTYLQLQIHKLGFNFKYIPSIVGVHDCPQNMKGICRKMLLELRGTANILRFSVHDKVQVPHMIFFLSYPLTLLLGFILLVSSYSRTFGFILIFASLLREMISAASCLKPKKYSLNIRVEAAFYSFGKEIFGMFYIPFYLFKRGVSLTQMMKILNVVFHWEIARWRSFIFI